MTKRKETDAMNVERFLDAQAGLVGGEDRAITYYEQALREIKDGFKESHWIWFIFPQLYGLSHSYFGMKYGIEDLDEAVGYLKNQLLRGRLLEISRALMEHKGKCSAVEILGQIDAVKVRSCMTLFACAALKDGDKDVLEVTHSVLKGFYPKCPMCEFTLNACWDVADEFKRFINAE